MKLLSGLFILLLSGCVTERDGVLFSDSVDKPRAIASHVEAANQYLREQDAQNAMRHLRAALQLDSNSQQVHAAMAISFELTKDYELAEKHHKRAIRIKGERQTSAINNYGVFLYKQGRYPEAQRQLDKVVDDALYSRRAAAFATLGLTKLQLGDQDGAKRAFDRSLTLDRQNGTALIELAEIAVLEGNGALAQRYYRNFNLMNRTTPRSLLVGIRIAAMVGDDVLYEKNAGMLKAVFPQTVEYAQYLKLYDRAN